MGVAEREDELDTELLDETDTQDDEGEQPKGDGEEGSEGGEGAGTDEQGGDGEDEEVIGFGGEEAPASEEAKAAPEWVKDLRHRQRELARENAELKAKLNAGQSARSQGKPELPSKPTLAGCDYDEEKFERARDAWDAKKREIDAWEATQQQAAEAQKRHAQAIDEHYVTTKAALKVKDFQEAEDEAAAALNPVQQSILKAGAADPARLVYALGKSPKKLQELASIKDPVKFAVAVGKLETEVKVTKRTSTKPAPESTVRSGSGSTATTAGSKATLERLEAEAERTGDRSKLIAFKRKQKQSGTK